jgi:hypothetical protein
MTRFLALLFSITGLMGQLLLSAATSKGAIAWDVSVNDPGSTYSAYYAPIETNLAAALNEYSRFLVSNTPSSIQIEISFSPSVTRSTGYSATSVFVGNVGGVNVYTQSVASEIATGVDPNGTTPDLYLKFQPSYLVNELWFDPTPVQRSAPVPADKTDAYSVILHELTHALGFNGWRDGTTGSLAGSPPYESTFDKWETFDGTNLFFTGPAAEANYDGPVPITFGNNFHIGNESPRPGSDLIPDMMNGVVYERGTRYDLSPLDRAILSDAGVGVINPPPGDYNGNGVVDAADYVMWRNNPSLHGGDPMGYNTWRQNFGAATGSGTLANGNAVPEPTITALLIVSLLAANEYICLVARKATRSLADQRTSSKPIRIRPRATLLVTEARDA